MLALHDVKPHTNKTLLSQPFNITLTLDSQGIEEAEFHVIYGGSPNTDAYDQIISNNIIGPIPQGLVKFDLECSIDLNGIPIRYLFGVTSIVVVGKFKEQEFLRIGYFAKVEYPGINTDELKCEEDEIESEINESNCEDDGLEEECADEENDEIVASEENEENKTDEKSTETEENKTEPKDTEDEIVYGEDKASIENTEENMTSEREKAHQIADEALGDELEIETGNATANLLTDSVLEKIKEAESLLEENQSVEGADKFAVTDDNSSDEYSSDDSMDESIEEDLVADFIEDFIFEHKGHQIDVRKITLELCEPPIETPFKIKWNDETEIVEEEEIEESEDNKIDVNNMDDEKEGLQISLDEPKKRKTEE